MTPAADKAIVGSVSINSPLRFTGVSSFSSDFQSILQRAAQIAQIPVTQLQAKDSNLLQQKTLLGSLNGAVADLASSLSHLGTVTAGRALTASSSDLTSVSVSNSSATQPASFTINSITSAATAASERTVQGFADSAATPVSSGTLTLSVGGVAKTFTLASNNLNRLVAAINGLNAGVTASVVTENGSNFLSVVSNSGPQQIQLFDGPTASGTDLLTSTGTGTEQSTAGFADPASTPVSKGTVTLQFGSTTQTIQLNSNSLISLRDQINALGIGVTASILTTSNGNFLSLSANATGATTLKLFDGPDTSGTNLLTNTNQGTNAVFSLNGINISQPGNVVNSVIPGVTFTILKSSSSPVTLTLASDRTQLSSALQNFVTKYNALKSQLNAQVGAAAGLLTGDTVVTQLQGVLRQIAAFRAPGSAGIQSLADLGIEFSSNGQASFDQGKFDSLTDNQVAQAFAFIGSATSGLGGFSEQLSTFSDPISGLIKIEQDGIDRTDSNIQKQIAALNDRISIAQANLASQLEAADAFQAQLEAQQRSLTASLQGLSLVLFGKNQNQNA